MHTRSGQLVLIKDLRTPLRVGVLPDHFEGFWMGGGGGGVWMGEGDW